MEVEGTPSGFFSDAIEERQIEEEPLKKCGGGSETTPQPAVSASGCFDCNICLDFAVDPVVTLCGHLYCWPCIYRWLQSESVTVHQCPVCKASLSQDSLVPLYGRGHNTKQSNQSFDIPRRPNSSIHHRGQTEIEPESAESDEEDNFSNNHPIPVHRHRHHHHHHPYSRYVSAPSSPSFGTTSRVIHSTAGGTLGGMAIAVLPSVLRNHQAMASMPFSAPSPYHVGGNGGNPRQRRQEMEVESSLHQIWVFLFCCAMLCLLLS